MSVVAALSALQVYSLSKQLEKQNQQLLKLASEDDSEAEPESFKDPLSEALQTMMILELKKRLGGEEQAVQSGRRQRNAASFDQTD